jgi:hypothetical protein
VCEFGQRDAGWRRGRGPVAVEPTTLDDKFGEGKFGDRVANLALNIVTNYFNVLAHVDNDWPVVSL